MRASRTRPLSAPRWRIAPASVRIVWQQELNHADDAVHRGADFVAHVGQKQLFSRLTPLRA